MMSEDKGRPKEPEKVRDTPSGVRPTVIGDSRTGDDPADQKPARPGGLHPTVISKPAGSKAPKAKQAKLTPQAPRTHVVVAPTAIPGTERKRIVVTNGDLRALSPQASARVVDEAARIVELFSPDTANERQAVLWGHDAQQRYGEHVARAVELSQSKVLTRTAHYLRRMVELLAAIDVEAASGAVAGEGLLARTLRRANARIDTTEELERARIEINQLVGLTGAALEDLLSLRQALERLDGDIARTADAIEASALAAQFLSDYLRNKREELSRRFLERSMSLTQSLVQLRGSASAASLQAEQPLRLITAIQNVVLVSLPDLLGSFAALNTLVRSGRRPTHTEAREIAFRLSDILQNLKA